MCSVSFVEISPVKGTVDPDLALKGELSFDFGSLSERTR